MLDVPVTIFIVTRNLGSPPRWDIADDHPEAGEPTMTAAQIRRSAENRLCRFGSHGTTHRRLTAISPADARFELAQSRADLETMLGTPVEEFAFPHGAFSAGLIEAAFAAGYRRVLTLDPSSARRCGEREVIGRMAMSPDVWFIEFVLTAAGAYDWLPALRRAARRLRGMFGRAPAAGLRHLIASAR
jgi:peptidoglycan/xylan/chitin deacetylase (PgdA/CDA1 family)